MSSKNSSYEHNFDQPELVSDITKQILHLTDASAVDQQVKKLKEAQTNEQNKYKTYAIFGGVVAAVGILIAIVSAAVLAGIAIGVIIALGGIALVMYFLNQRNKVSITFDSVKVNEPPRAFALINWVVKHHKIGDKSLIVDKSGIVDEVSVQVPELIGDAIDISDKAARLEEVTSPDVMPLLMAHGGDDVVSTQDGILKGKEEIEINSAIEDLTGALQSSPAKDVTVDLPLISGDSSLGMYIRQALSGNSAGTIGGISTEIDEVEIELDQFNNLERTFVAHSSVDRQTLEAIPTILSTLKDNLEDLSDMRKKKVFETFTLDQLDLIEDASAAAVRDFLCPNCASNSKESLVNRDAVNRAKIDTETLSAVFGDSDELARAYDGIENLLRSSKLRVRYACGKCSHPLKNTDSCDYCGDPVDERELEWYCPLCEYRNPEDPPASALRITKVKEDIILPLWDILWDELHADKAALISNRFKENRDNHAKEKQDLRRLAEAFADAHISLRERLDNLHETALRSSATLEGVLEAFVSNELFSQADASDRRRVVEEFKSEHLENLNVLRNKLTDEQSEISDRVETRDGKGDREDILDPTLEVKVVDRVSLPATKTTDAISAPSNETSGTTDDPSDELDLIYDDDSDEMSSGELIEKSD